MRRRWRWALAVILLLGLVAGAVLIPRFLRWQAVKQALLLPPPAPLQPRRPPPPSTGGFLLFGDSRVEEWRPLAERAYPVVQIGFSGESAIRLVPGFAEAVRRYRPRAALLIVGVNDAVGASQSGAAARAAGLQRSLAAFERMAALARACGVSLTIARVLPPVRPDPLRRLLWRGELAPHVAALNAGLPAIAARHGATLIDLEPLLAGPDGGMAAQYRADHVHWTPAAYRQLNQLLSDRLPASPAGDPGLCDALTTAGQ